MSKRTANLLDANLAAPPSVSTFLEALKKQYKARQVKPDPVHGTMLQNATKQKASGALCAERAAVQSALDFVALCDHLNAVYEDLDSWLVAWAAWVIDPDVLFETAQEIAACRQRRKDQPGALFRVKKFPVASFRTYLNARVYSKGAPVHHWCPHPSASFRSSTSS